METVLSVSELTQAIKKQLEGRFPLVSVRGEVSNFKEQSSGHLYFTLKDAEAQISAVLFKGNTRGLSRLPKGGDQIVVKGELSVYAPRGNYQIIIRELQYAGVGELLLKLHELKLKLELKGWFAKERKRPLPKFPKTIGVVTSPTGAVIQDILHILNRRFSGFHLILNPVKVQGEGAAAEIAQAIEQFNRYGLADVLIVGRGGGSLEDLWAFNEEVVAAAIYSSKIPVISAVGHETDFSIADYVADIRAPTPSAAAEIAIGEKAQHKQFLAQTHKRAAHSLLSSLRQSQQKMDHAAEEVESSILTQIQRKRLQLLALKKQSAALSPLSQIKAMRQKLTHGEKSLRAFVQVVGRKKERLSQLVAHLRAIDPRNLLTKGYCILFPEKNNSVILSAKALQREERIRIAMHDGQIKATVTETT